MKFRFLSTALLELSESSDYYEKEIAGLGIEFLDEVESTIVRILKYPNAWGRCMGSVQGSMIFVWRLDLC